eukprot:749496-Hanusia_phi.AAC.2
MDPSKDEPLNGAEASRDRNLISLDPLTKKSKRTHRKKSQVPNLIDSYEGMQRPSLVSSKKNGRHESKKSKISKLSEDQQDVLRRFFSFVLARLRLMKLKDAVNAISWAPRVMPPKDEVQKFVQETGGKAGTYLKDTFRVSSEQKGDRPSIIGSFQWTKIDTSDPAKFMVVNINNNNGIGRSYHTGLIRFFMEHVWGIRRPDVVISVTGGVMNSARCFLLLYVSCRRCNSISARTRRTRLCGV